jgi:site-specific DNA-methyltransferase (adenine-specific)
MNQLDTVEAKDCFEAATALDDQSVDVVLTDPPYPNRMNLFPDTLVDGLAMLYIACKKAKRYVVFFWNPFDVPMPPPGWHEVARHVWHKPDCKSITHYEVIVAWSKDPKQRVSRVWSIPILDYRSLHDWKPHPTQKPVKLLRYLLEQYTEEGEIVFDPFVGSGTTAVACKQMKRHYIACDSNPTYVSIANDRLKGKSEESTEEPQETPSTDETESDAISEDEQPQEEKKHEAPKRRPKKKPSDVAA